MSRYIECTPLNDKFIAVYEGLARKPWLFQRAHLARGARLKVASLLPSRASASAPFPHRKASHPCGMGSALSCPEGAAVCGGARGLTACANRNVKSGLEATRRSRGRGRVSAVSPLAAIATALWGFLSVLLLLANLGQTGVTERRVRLKPLFAARAASSVSKHHSAGRSCPNLARMR